MDIAMALAMTAGSSLVSAVVAAVVSALIMKIKVARKASADAKQNSEELKQIVLIDTKMICRLVIYSDKFSVDEKLDAYVIYRDRCNGNHQTKKYMDELVGMDVDKYLEKHRKD